MRNCLTYAFQPAWGNENLVPVENLDENRKPEVSVIQFAKKYGLDCRQVGIKEIHEQLQSDEWLIVFWGFFDSYDPDDYIDHSSYYVADRLLPDYHFARKCKDGKWRHRMGWDKPVEEITLQEKISLFNFWGVPPRFFIVKKAGV